MFKEAFRLSKKLIVHNLKLISEHRKRQEFYSGISDNTEYWSNITNTLFENHEPIFVLSTGRCGSELLTNILSTTGGLCCYHKPSPELLGFEPLAYRQSSKEPQSFELALRMARFDLVLDCMIRNCRYVETSYRCTFFAYQLHEIFPKAKFIHLVRSPIAFIESAVRLGFYSTGLLTDIGRITPAGSPYQSQWTQMSIYEKNAWLWNETNLFIEEFKAATDSSKVLTILSDELFNNEQTINTLAQFANFTISEQLKSRIKSIIAKKTNVKSSRSDVKKYSAWNAQQKESINNILTLSKSYNFPAGK